MKKLIPFIAAFFFPVFVVGVFAAMMLYSWQALANLFPDDLMGQIFGMLMFDLAALIWFAVMVYQSNSIAQYVLSFVGFLVGLVGTLGLISIEVGLSSGLFEAGSMQQPLTYIFIGVLVGHVILIYAHKAAAPEMAADISLGIEKAKITGRAEEEATRLLTADIEGLSAPIAERLVRTVKDDLGLGSIKIEKSENPISDSGAPGQGKVGSQSVQGDVEEVKPGFLSLLPDLHLRGNGDRKFGMSVRSAGDASRAQTPRQSPAQTDAVNGEADGGEPK